MAIIAAVIIIMLLGAGYIFFGISSRTISLKGPPASTEEPGEEEKQENKNKSDEVSQNIPAPPDKKEESKKSAPVKKEESSKEMAVTERLLKSGFSESGGRAIDTIVLHASYDALGTDPHSVEGVIREYEMYGVSAHYLVDRNGKVYQLVKDNNIAWHAGASIMPDGRTNVNQFSIGIELLYTKKEEPNSDQYESLKKLIADLKKKYPIKNIVGHNQIAPERKDDPWNFDWKSLNR